MTVKVKVGIAAANYIAGTAVEDAKVSVVEGMFVARDVVVQAKTIISTATFGCHDFHNGQVCC